MVAADPVLLRVRTRPGDTSVTGSLPTGITLLKLHQNRYQVLGCFFFLENWEQLLPTHSLQ